MNTRVISLEDITALPWEFWDKSTFISSRHSLRREVNRLRIQAWSRHTGNPLYMYRCRYENRQTGLNESTLRALRQLNPNKHDNVESELYLCLGMPVVLYENSHTSQGITNGSYATLVEIQLDHRDKDTQPDPNGFVHLKFIPPQLLVKLRDSHPDRLSLHEFETNVIPIVPKEVRIQLKLGTTSRSFKTRQLPLAPAYAVTNYRVQGETCDIVLADLRPPFGAPVDPADGYVQISRATKLEKLFILRPFPITALQKPPSPALLVDEQRCRHLQLQTIARLNQVRVYLLTIPIKH